MEIEAQLESLDRKIEKNSKKTDKLSRLVTSLVTSVEQNSSQEEIKGIVSEIQKDYSKNQKGLNKKITELKTAITKANDTIENFSQSIFTGNGFVFDLYGGEKFTDKIMNAYDIFKNKFLWNRLMKNAFNSHYSWDGSVKEYEKMYKTAAQRRLNYTIYGM